MDKPSVFQTLRRIARGSSGISFDSRRWSLQADHEFLNPPIDDFAIAAEQAGIDLREKIQHFRILPCPNQFKGVCGHKDRIYGFSERITQITCRNHRLLRNLLR